MSYDMHELLSAILDNGAIDEFQADLAREMICGDATIEGIPVGVIANGRGLIKGRKGEKPRFGGIVYAESAEKVAYFIDRCDRQGIPLPFLLNILAELRTAGLVQSRRGAEGGYRLALAADEIAVADVIRAVDGPLANIAGDRPEDVAYSGAAVALRDVWIALRATMRTVLEGVTLADIAGGTLPGPLADLLKDEDVWKARI